MKWIILTAKEIQAIQSYCIEHNNKNVVISSYNQGIGDMKIVNLQDEWCDDKNYASLDITDYESW